MKMKWILFVWVLSLWAISANSYGQEILNLNDPEADGLPGMVSPAPDSGALPPAPLVNTTGKLLIDRSHEETFDVSGFTNFLVSQGWTVDEVATGPITETLLSQYDIFMIPTVISRGIDVFSPSEVTAVNDYVQGGGGLWVFHEYNGDPSGVNSVSSQFGVTFNNDRVTDPTNNEGEIFWPTIHILTPHQITQGVSSYGYYAGSSLNVISPANVIGKGDDDASSTYYPSFPPVLAAAAAGSGRVVFSGDITPLHPSYYPSQLRPEEELLLSNIVDWLANAELAPRPDIQANGSDEPVMIAPGDKLTVTVALNPGSHEGDSADWWVAAATPFGFYWYTLSSGWVQSDVPIRVYGGPLFSLPPYTVLEISTLPAGAYTFYFGCDMVMNGSLDMDRLYYDQVEVNITP